MPYSNEEILKIDEEAEEIRELYRMALDRSYIDYERIVFNRFPDAQDGIAQLKAWEDGTYTLVVNYYKPCTVEFEKEKIHVEIKDEAPDDYGKFFLHVIAEGKKLRNVRVRAPYWAQMGDNDSGRKLLSDGRMHHEVWAEFTYSFRIEHPFGRPDLGAICYGPYVLAILDDRQENLTLQITEEMLNQRAKVLSMEEFEYDGMKLCPLYFVGDRAYHTYFNCI